MYFFPVSGRERGRENSLYFVALYFPRFEKGLRLLVNFVCSPELVSVRGC